MNDNIEKIFHLDKSHWGACVEENETQMQYGIYETVTRTFAFTFFNPRRLTFLSNLFSSRFDLRLINLTTASNFNSTLIDNSCCENWCLNKKDISSVVSAERESNEIISASELFQRDSNYGNNELLINNKQYFNYVINLLVLFDDLIGTRFEFVTTMRSDWDTGGTSNYNKQEYNFHYQHITVPIEFKDYKNNTLEYYYYLRKAVYDVVYTEFDFEIAKAKIEKLLSTIL